MSRNKSLISVQDDLHVDKQVGDELLCLQHTCDLSRHVVKVPIWRLPLRPYDEAVETPDDKFFLCYFFSNLIVTLGIPDYPIQHNRPCPKGSSASNHTCLHLTYLLIA